MLLQTSSCMIIKSCRSGQLSLHCAFTQRLSNTNAPSSLSLEDLGKPVWRFSQYRSSEKNIGVEPLSGNLLSSSGLFMRDWEQYASLCAAEQRSEVSWDSTSIFRIWKISFSAASFAVPFFSLKKLKQFLIIFSSFIQEFVL